MAFGKASMNDLILQPILFTGMLLAMMLMMNALAFLRRRSSGWGWICRSYHILHS